MGNSNKGAAPAAVRALVVGETGIGKTSFCLRVSEGEFPQGLDVDDEVKVYVKDAEGDRLFPIVFFDTNGNLDRDTARPSNYNNNIVMLCYAVNDKWSLEEVTDYWAPKVKNLLNDIPIILVGLKLDAREETEVEEDIVATEEGSRVADEIGCKAHFECSTKDWVGVEELLAAIVEIGGADLPKPKSGETQSNFNFGEAMGGMMYMSLQAFEHLDNNNNNSYHGNHTHFTGFDNDRQFNEPLEGEQFQLHATGDAFTSPEIIGVDENFVATQRLVPEEHRVVEAPPVEEVVEEEVVEEPVEEEIVEEEVVEEEVAEEEPVEEEVAEEEPVEEEVVEEEPPEEEEEVEEEPPEEEEEVEEEPPEEEEEEVEEEPPEEEEPEEEEEEVEEEPPEEEEEE